MLRKIASKLHLYLGLTVFVLLIPIGLTGGVLVFEDELDAALHPELVRVEPEGERVPVEAVVAVVRNAFPGDGIARLELPRETNEPYEAVLTSGRQVYVNPYGGAVLGAQRPGETLTGWLFVLHTELLAGSAGKTIVGVTGLVLLVLSLTGLVLWWRGRRQLRRGLTVKWGGDGRRINYDVHNALGFYVVIPLVVVTFTGAGLVFYTAFSSTAHAVSGTPQPPAPPASVCCPEAPPPPLDHFIEQAQARFPEARPARVDFPHSATAAVRVRLKLPEELHPIGLTMVYLDQYSGEVLRAESALEVPAARRFGYVFYPLHIGSFGGAWVKVLYALLGVAPVVLAVTGVVIWYLRCRKRRHSGLRRAVREDARRVPTRRAVLADDLPSTQTPSS